MSLFFANYGYNLKLGVEPTGVAGRPMTRAEKEDLYTAEQVIERFERILGVVTTLACQSSDRYKRHANKHRD